MRRVAAISAPPRSANPRGRRALSLLVLSGLSAIIALHCRPAGGSSRPAQRQGTHQGTPSTGASGTPRAQHHGEQQRRQPCHRHHPSEQPPSPPTSTPLRFPSHPTAL